jgi:hypothetical protein
VTTPGDGVFGVAKDVESVPLIWGRIHKADRLADDCIRCINFCVCPFSVGRIWAFLASNVDVFGSDHFVE